MAVRRRKRYRKIKLSLPLLLLLLAVAYFALRYAGLMPESHHMPEISSAALSGSTVDISPEAIPDYAGTDVIELSGNVPNFTTYDYDHIGGESFAGLDALGRCRTAEALLHCSMMPAGERERMMDVKPSGWVQKKYPGLVDSQPPYLYNRCHLIAWALTGRNADPENLITGTRYLNAELMLPYEIEVARYLDHSENHVLYRVSPLYRGDELLARGVEMEARSVEDHGKGVCFHVFLYNVQPGVELDYATGESRELAGEKRDT